MPPSSRMKGGFCRTIAISIMEWKFSFVTPLLIISPPRGTEESAVLKNSTFLPSW